jgi:hypothetical protein
VPRQDIIYFRAAVPATSTEKTGQSAAEERRGLDISWSRPDENGDTTPGNVQIGMSFSPEELRRLSQPYSDGSFPFVRATYTEPLSRDQLNLMIRTLRRARDAAYGADE